MADSAHTTVDPAEIERFSRIAGEWWDPSGKFAPLHRLNRQAVYGLSRVRSAVRRGLRRAEDLLGNSSTDADKM